MTKLDIGKLYKSYYTAKAKPELTDIGKAFYLSIEGKGDPSEEDFIQKIQAIYATAYTLKFLYKAEGNDFVVAKLEAQWWFDPNLANGFTIAETPKQIPRNLWQYRLLIRLPEYVTTEQVQQAIQNVKTKKPLLHADKIKHFELHEGKTVQMLHTGPFATEPETLAHIQQFIQQNQLKQNGLHHEIYLSDFRKTAPSKLKTILREPVK